MVGSNIVGRGETEITGALPSGDTLSVYSLAVYHTLRM